MDIVTAGRAIVRRWYLFIPVLVVGILASVHIAQATKPTFESSGQFIVLNGAVRPATASGKDTTKVAPTKDKGKSTASATSTPTPTPTPEPTTTVVYPYLGSTDLLRAALLAQLNGDAFQSQLAQAGNRGTYTVSIEKKQPLFIVTGSARHRKTAVALVNAVLDQANAQVRLVQTKAGAPSSGLLGAQILTQASPAADVTSGKSKRLVAGVVITVAAAIALSIALDSSVLVFHRRRTARKAGDPAVSGAGGLPQSAKPSDTTGVPQTVRVRPAPSAPSAASTAAEPAEKPTTPVNPRTSRARPTRSASASAPSAADTTPPATPPELEAKGPLGRLLRRSQDPET